MSNKKIKSNYIIKLIFSFVFESNKLKIIKYNKNLQNILNIDNVNYFIWFGKGLTLDKYGNGVITSAHAFLNLFEGKYKNGKKNGKGKEYTKFGDLLFEGYFIDDKKNGKGKEYCPWSGKLLFVGEYKNGKRHGKGIEYDYDKKIIFKGEYLNGKFWSGIGKEKYDIFIFKGEYKYGKKWKGKEYYHIFCGDPLHFEGEFKEGKKWKGIFYYKEGNIKYKGEIVENKMWNGILYSYDGKEQFEIKNGKGRIKRYFRSLYEGSLCFEGQLLDGLNNGKGKEYFVGDNNKIKFEGEYINGHKWNGIGYNINGQKQYELKDGSGYIFEYNNNNLLIFEGEVVRGIRTGIGKEYENEKLLFEGFYLRGKRHGKGKLYDLYSDEGKLSYEGDFANGMKNGYGKDYLSGCLQYEGEFIDDKMQGKGIKYSNGKISKKGIFFKDFLIKGNIYTDKGILKEEIEYRYFLNNAPFKEFLWKGKIYNDRGIIRYEGTKLKGILWTGIGYDPYGKKAFEIKNGKGIIKKYYETGELKINAEFLYGYILGNGKEYYKNGNMKYKGFFVYIVGEKILGNKYDETGKLLFSGEIYNGEKYKYTEPIQSYIKTKIIIISIFICFIAFAFTLNNKAK